METNQNPKSDRNGTRTLLPPAEDYLGQWIAVLGEHYPGELSALSVLAYRIALEDLSPRELDLAFSQALRKNRSSFRPTGGEILKYLWEARSQLTIAEFPALPEAELTEEEKAQFLQEIKNKAAGLPKDAPVVIDMSEEELVRRKEQLKKSALEWAQRHGSEIK